jgi:hypothetical protein
MNALIKNKRVTGATNKYAFIKAPRFFFDYILHVGLSILILTEIKRFE